MLYPLKFKPLYKDYVWGGRNLTQLGKAIPAEGIVAESWEVACHKNGSSIVANGAFEGTELPVLIRKFGRKLIGEALLQKDVDKFPLLVKFIDAENNLSVQVHPDDAYAMEKENGEYGKNEMWYIISAKPGAKLVHGFVPGTVREGFAQAVAENRVERCLKSIPVFAGDIINIPAGTVHAVGAGILLAEIQQNSDTTYRIYDYGRAGRPLHIEKALEVIDFRTEERPDKFPGLELSLGSGGTRKIAIANPYFCAEVLHISGDVREHANGDKFYIYTFTAGKGAISWDSGAMAVGAGESLLIPSSLGVYELSGELTALRSYVPDLKEDVIRPLKLAGWSESDIAASVGGMDRIVEK